MPKLRKQTFKTTQCDLKRIYHRNLIWNENGKLELKFLKYPKIHTPKLLYSN